MADTPSFNEETEPICSLCEGNFNIVEEGGISGEIGMLPVAFCPTCLAGTIDMVHQLMPCPHCEKGYDEEEEG